MYHQPFGSIFSDHKPTQFGSIFSDTKTEQIPAEKPLVDTIPFKETTTIEFKNPEAQLIQIDNESAQKQQQLKLLQLDIDAVKTKISSSQQYINLLIEYLNLSDTDKNNIKALIADKAQTVKNLITAKQLQKLATKTQIQNAMLDTKIKHAKNISELKKEGLDAGTPILKYYRPIKDKVTTVLPITREIPKIMGRVPTDELYTLTQLGQIDESYFGKFKENCPSPQSFKDARKYAYQKAHLPKKIEQTLLLNKQIDWKIKDLSKEKTTQLKLYDDNKNKAVDLINRITTSDPSAKSSLTAIGVLVENNPKKFNSSLLTSLNNILNIPKQLGQTDATTDPTDPSQQSITQASQNAQSALQEQQAKQISLVQLTTGSTQPASQSVISIPIVTINTTALLKKFLPWVIGILIVLNLLK